MHSNILHKTNRSEPKQETFRADFSNFANDRQKMVQKTKEVMHNCCTQTSKTILQLAQLEAGDISPDSLSSTPRRPKHIHRKSGGDDTPSDLTAFSTLTQDGSFLDNTSIPFSRKNSITEYMHSTDEQMEDSRGEQDSKPNFKSTYLDKSLTQRFLEKKTAYLSSSNNAYITGRSEVSTDRSKFLQQTSPLRKIMQDEVDLNFKSQSFVEPGQSCQFAPDFRDFGCATRFKVKNVSNVKTTYKETVPVRCYCPNIFRSDENETDSQSEQVCPSSHLFRQHRSNSFMMPTIASSSKDQTHQIERISKLISPTRRGRSISPHKSSEPGTALSVKVPYIDQSQTNGVSDTSTMLQDYTSSSQSVKTIKKYDEDLLKINLDFKDLHCESQHNSEVIVGEINDAVILSALNKLRENDWNVSLKGLAEIVEIARVLEDDFLLPHMSTVNQRLIDLLRSSRSHVCRTACQAAGNLFEYVKDTRRPEFDDIVDTLLFKTADSNKFIRQDANLALDCMVTHISTVHAVRSLCSKGPTHKNHLVRTATVRLLVCAVVIAGPDSIFNPNNNESTRKRLIMHVVTFVDDKNFETRKFGERLYRVLCKSSRFELYLKKYVTKESIADLKKKVKLISQRRF